MSCPTCQYLRIPADYNPRIVSLEGVPDKDVTEYVDGEEEFVRKMRELYEKVSIILNKLGLSCAKL